MSSDIFETNIRPAIKPSKIHNQLLLVEVFPDTSREEKLLKFPLTLGRSDDCDITFTDYSISRQHAQLKNTAKGYLIKDLGSKNGCFVNMC